MIHDFKGWEVVAEKLTELVDKNVMILNNGQKNSLRALKTRLPNNGVIIADEVGMGKTRIAVAVAKSVVDAGGRVAILVPPGLGYQWGDELRSANIQAPLILRSLWQYLQAWENNEPEKQRPWFGEQVVLISHAFTNWRLGENSESWRWTLLPELYATWRKQTDDRFPRTYIGNEKLDKECVKNAAESIVKAIFSQGEGHINWTLIVDLVKNTPWPGALESYKYAKSSQQLRPCLEKAVGLGMGIFDLVIIDEAHKSRGQDSGLNRLLENVVLHSDRARRLAMTATPVELDAKQWSQSLARIKVPGLPKFDTAITHYSEAVRSVRQTPIDTKTRETYEAAAEQFQTALSPYLLRRSKSEDEFVMQFRNNSTEGFHAYRQEKKILVKVAALSPGWKQTVCAAEALSFVTRQAVNLDEKRLRLTLGNGHGLAKLIDDLHFREEGDNEADETDDASSLLEKIVAEETVLPKKASQRARWWKKIMTQSLRRADSGEDALYDHPAILAAVEAIEDTCLHRGEKVLVFGRFTRPLRALVNLLNAREMLRRIETRQAWPQSKALDSEWAAISVAQKQLWDSGKLPRTGQLTKDDLNSLLEQQYKVLEQQRRTMRENLIEKISEGIKGNKYNGRVKALFEAFKIYDSARPETDQIDGEQSLTVVARAVNDLIGPDVVSATPSVFADAFADIIDAANDRNEGDEESDGDLQECEAGELWGEIVLPRLREEYGYPKGGFARLMNGGTQHSTRRFLQLAFNRIHAHPKVLVTQSKVGREGLNLHKACRTVVLLHPEWNPGVVEQQIGRVDRLGSLWESKLQEALKESTLSEPLPRIEIRPVIFQGTYDEKNWQVLRDRWDDLCAQLHGIVISPRIANKYLDSVSVIESINKAAPDFSPTLADSA